MTGCLPPCSYREYKVLSSKVTKETKETEVVVWNTSPYMAVEREELLYTLNTGSNTAELLQTQPFLGANQTNYFFYF